MLAGLILLIVTGLGNPFLERVVVSKPIWICGTKIAEWVHLTLLWLILFVLLVILAYSEDYFVFCETSASLLTQVQLRAVVHCATMSYSFLRFLCLPSRRRATPKGSSSQGFANHIVLPWTSTQISPSHGNPNATLSSSSGIKFLKTNVTSKQAATANPNADWEDAGEETEPVSSLYYCAAIRRGEYTPIFHISNLLPFGCRVILFALLSKCPVILRWSFTIRNLRHASVFGLYATSINSSTSLI